MTFGSSETGITTVAEARELVALSLDAGVNLIDTADVYGGGRSEELLGEALGTRRDEVLVATKSFMPSGEGPNDIGSSRRHIVASCEASLRRLGTDWIDLYQIHQIDELTEPEETLGALDDLVRSGKVRAIGCSNYSAWHIMRALGVSDRYGLPRFASLQAYYSLLARELEHEHVPLCLAEDMGIIVWSPLAGGLLSGKVTRDAPPAPGTRAAIRDAPGSFAPEQAFAIVDVLMAIGAERGVSATQVALNWVRARRGVASVLVGARTREQLLDNLAAAEWKLSTEEIERLDDVSDLPLPYPYWHQQRYGAQRLRWSRPHPRGERCRLNDGAAALWVAAAFRDDAHDAPARPRHRTAAGRGRGRARRRLRARRLAHEG